MLYTAEHGDFKGDFAGFKAALRALVPDGVVIFDSVESTNDALKDLAQSAGDGAAAIALEQTAGRGRLGRGFFSPRGAGIYLSVLRKFDSPPGELVSLTVQAAAVCALAVEGVTGQKVGIKWVNDLFLEKKFAGILCESVPLPPGREKCGGTAVITGIGVNCSPPPGGFPDGVDAQALGKVDRAGLAAALIAALRAMSGRISEGELAFYKSRSTVLGKPVTCTRMGAAVASGVAVDVTREGFLLVRQDDGALVTLSSGEISVRVA